MAGGGYVTRVFECGAGRTVPRVTIGTWGGRSETVRWLRFASRGATGSSTGSAPAACPWSGAATTRSSAARSRSRCSPRGWPTTRPSATGYARRRSPPPGSRHPHITGIFDFGEYPLADQLTVPYVVMELNDGESVAARIGRQGSLPWREAVTIAAEVASALATAHARGLVHRDVTPANVMLTGAGAKVVDFGISAAVGQRDAAPDGSLLGTPAYLAPERLGGGQVSAATDVYALGLLLYRSLTGRLPWPAETTAEALRAHLYADPDPVPDAARHAGRRSASSACAAWPRARRTGPARPRWRAALGRAGRAAADHPAARPPAKPSPAPARGAAAPVPSAGTGHPGRGFRSAARPSPISGFPAVRRVRGPRPPCLRLRVGTARRRRPRHGRGPPARRRPLRGPSPRAVHLRPPVLAAPGSGGGRAPWAC